MIENMKCSLVLFLIILASSAGHWLVQNWNAQWKASDSMKAVLSKPPYIPHQHILRIYAHKESPLLWHLLCNLPFTESTALPSWRPFSNCRYAIVDYLSILLHWELLKELCMDVSISNVFRGNIAHFSSMVKERGKWRNFCKLIKLNRYSLNWWVSQSNWLYIQSTSGRHS